MRELMLQLAAAVRTAAQAQIRATSMEWYGAVLMHAEEAANMLDLLDLAALVDEHQPPAVAVPEEMPAAVLDAVADALGDAYDCMRVWSAWSVGSMGPDDFYEVRDDVERLDEISRAAINAWITSQTDLQP